MRQGLLVVGQAQVCQEVLPHAEAVTAAAGTEPRVVTRVEDGDEEPAVAASTPSPVDVEEVLAIEAIDDKGMSSAR